MPELPDITVYVEALSARVTGDVLVAAQVPNLFMLRTVDPPLSALVGRRVEGVTRLGKRVVVRFEGAHVLVIHLMVAGRLWWADAGGKPFKRQSLATLVFPRGTLYLTEAGTKRRASIHLGAGPDALRPHDRGGLEPLTCKRLDRVPPELVDDEAHRATSIRTAAASRAAAMGSGEASTAASTIAPSSTLWLKLPLDNGVANSKRSGN